MAVASSTQKAFGDRSVEFLEAIKRVSIDRWGERHFITKLAEGYIKLAGDEDTMASRRPHISRIFKKGSCNLETALILAEAAGLEVSFSYTTTQRHFIDLAAS